MSVQNWFFAFSYALYGVETSAMAEQWNITKHISALSSYNYNRPNFIFNSIQFRCEQREKYDLKAIAACSTEAMELRSYNLLAFLCTKFIDFVVNKIYILSLKMHSTFPPPLSFAFVIHICICVPNCTDSSGIRIKTSNVKFN